MSHWSKSAAQRFIEQRSTKSTEAAKVLHDQEMIQLKAPELWDQLSEEFSRKCKEFNSEPEVGNLLSFDGSDTRELKIARSDTGATLIVAFLPFYTVTVQGLKDRGEFKFQVVPGTSEVGLFNSKEQLLAPDVIATVSLDMFLTD